MKNLLLISALFIVSTMTVQAQKIYRYIGTCQKHFVTKPKPGYWESTDSRQGTISISGRLVKFNWDSKGRQAMVLIADSTESKEIHFKDSTSMQSFISVGLGKKRFKLGGVTLEYYKGDLYKIDVVTNLLITTYYLIPYKNEIKRIGKKVTVDYN